LDLLEKVLHPTQEEVKGFEKKYLYPYVLRQDGAYKLTFDQSHKPQAGGYYHNHNHNHDHDQRSDCGGFEENSVLEGYAEGDGDDDEISSGGGKSPLLC
jgi:hypothetical protein